MRAVLASVLLLVAMPALGQSLGGPPPPPASKIELAVRLGFGLPFGKLDDEDGSQSLSKDVAGVIPVWIEGSYRFTPNLQAGVNLSYGYVIGKNCSGKDSCNGHQLRFGIHGAYHIQPAQKFDPWVGIGFGYESLGSSAEEQGSKVTVTATGWEFLNLQVGGDVKVGQTFWLGPFVSFQVDETTSLSADFNGGSFSVTDFKKALHEWLVFGIRGRLDI
jgi:outer membrane protein W